MFGRSGGYFPLVSGSDGAGSDVAGVDDGWFAWERATAVDVDALAEGMADAGDPVVCEDAFFFVEDAVCDALGEGRAVDAECVFLADGLIPAAE